MADFVENIARVLSKYHGFPPPALTPALVVGGGDTPTPCPPAKKTTTTVVVVVDAGWLTFILWVEIRFRRSVISEVRIALDAVAAAARELLLSTAFLSQDCFCYPFWLSIV